MPAIPAPGLLLLHEMNPTATPRPMVPGDVFRQSAAQPSAAERRLSWAADFPHGLDAGLVFRRPDGRIAGNGRVDHRLPVHGPERSDPRLRRVRGRPRDRFEPRSTASAAPVLSGVVGCLRWAQSGRSSTSAQFSIQESFLTPFGTRKVPGSSKPMSNAMFPSSLTNFALRVLV